MAGICFWTIMFPIDAVKTRIQVFKPDISFPKYTLQIIRNEGNSIRPNKQLKYCVLGFTTLYAGLLPTLIRTFLATGTLFITYEQTRLLLHRVI
jgi:hypothetical protein